MTGIMDAFNIKGNLNYLRNISVVNKRWHEWRVVTRKRSLFHYNSSCSTVAECTLHVLDYSSTAAIVLRDGTRKEITGIVVNETLAIPSEYKKKLRQEIFFCKKYGIEDHLKHTGTKYTDDQYRKKLLGRINYVLSVENNNKEMKAYKEWLLKFK